MSVFILMTNTWSVHGLCLHYRIHGVEATSLHVGEEQRPAVMHLPREQDTKESSRPTFHTPLPSPTPSPCV